jgi:hypothetical protein
MTFSSTLMLKKICRFWNVREMPRVATWCGSSPARLEPSNSMAPSLGT